ncbi:MAG TPA: maleylacetate reductase [Kineosporiaceae bacterium]|nr:maleylacetate reductase [Kineosporiaceae bacterium]
MSTGLAFSYESRAQRVVFGAGTARTDLAAEIERLGCARVLVVAAHAERELAEELTSVLPVVATFLDVRQHVPLETATAARALAGTSGADSVLSIGGGSTTGTAKAIAMTTGLPIIAVPTTYAGSEATAVWGLTDAGRKSTGTDPAVLPRTVIYDPELTLSLPADLTVASGLNAMAHCVDSLWAPNANPMSSAMAVAGIRGLRQALPEVRRDGSNLDARAAALSAAYLAAVAFTTAGSGLHHKICHVLGGTYDLPHAPTHAVVLPYVAAFNVSSAPSAAALLADALGVPDPVSGLVELYASLGAPGSLRELGLSSDDLPEAARLVAEAAPASNPRPVGRDDAALILRHAWAGDRPGSDQLEAHR